MCCAHIDFHRRGFWLKVESVIWYSEKVLQHEKGFCPDYPALHDDVIMQQKSTSGKPEKLGEIQPNSESK